MNRKRIYLAPPHMSGLEMQYIQEAFDSGWVAPLGPQVDAFEEEFARKVGARYALALSAGTAGIHLALVHLGVSPGDEVLVSSLTFVASANPVVYQGGRPVFIDSERQSWNMDPNLLEDALKRKAQQGKLPKAVIVVHLYGQSANLDPVVEICDRYGVALIEDAAEALGATYMGRPVGTFGHMGIFSFNGNKIISTSGGGMLVSDEAEVIAHARKLATQSRNNAPHYEHSEVGYNYRMSNILAAIGRAQLRVLDDRVRRKQEIFEVYRQALSDLPGVAFMMEAPWGRHSRWLTIIIVDPDESGITREDIRVALEQEDIESRPIWKPMHLQPLFRGCEVYGGKVAEELFEKGLCLPSGTGMKPEEQDRVIEVIRRVFRR